MGGVTRSSVFMLYNDRQCNMGLSGQSSSITAMAHPSAAEQPIRLADLHGYCELNYARLMRLYADMRIVPERVFQAGVRQQFSLSFKVLERSRYTTALRLDLGLMGLPWAGFRNLRLCVYHDARMAEVTGCNLHRLDRIRYLYPNPAMHQPDEKVQLNHFLGIWLDYFLAEGCIADPSGFHMSAG